MLGLKWGIKCTLHTIKSTAITSALQHPSVVDLEILYMRCFGSGLAERAKDHLTFAKYVGGVISNAKDTSWMTF